MISVEWDTLIQTLLPPHTFRGQRAAFSELTHHSARVTEGALFFAIPGTKTNGFDFIKQVLEKGAGGIVVTEALFPKVRQLFPSVSCLGVSDVRLALALATPLFFPQKPAFMAAVTGTNGKTSVAHFTRQLWGALEQKAASIGTLGLCLERVDLALASGFPNQLNTPDPLLLYPCLDLLAAKQVNFCILEASSHGLDQKRLHGLYFSVGIFTSFSQDHLDYHADMDRYWETKTRLFSELIAPKGIAILNAQLPRFSELKALCLAKKLTVWSYGVGGKEFELIQTRAQPHGQQVICRFFGQETTFFLPFSGSFQAENFLAALAVVHASGFSLPNILKAFPPLTAVPGRLEHIGKSPTGGDVYVDYAHTPDALQVALSNLRPHTTGKIHLVFGCGGERDSGKRPEMGRIAALLADTIIVTDDNPRSESPRHIRAQILEGCPRAQEIGNREKAIQKGIEQLARGDTLLIAGKGHEAYQIIGSEMKPFDDRTAAHKLLEALKNRTEP